ncbi:heat shock protein transcriptional repressor HspR [Corynebacterium aquatimens]|uniref:MerR family transcriptional regulator/heat shock protein HspR n=1 Tax=Corynebacterium aquatimens TaxID=1190508 RepID=A0A931GWQ1_9CORY|nr:MerR family transcriptional regulator [Corynebacterium aquatimens]MBG6122911.1 MerR family transcriptional regulator/heat shock protein HspR [Corynebacterium aquatimens]WJY66754.1 Putative heat shock protein HspR [Corynebacterium aquatimens]
MSDRTDSTPHNPNPSREEPEFFVISAAAALTGMHAQTLRTYDRMGLVSPARTRGGGRRYSRRDISTLRTIQRLSQEEGVNLAGIKTIIELTERIDDLEHQLDSTTAKVDVYRAENAKLKFELGRTEQELASTQQELARGTRRGGELVHVPRSKAVVTWTRKSRDSRRSRD